MELSISEKIVLWLKQNNNNNKAKCNLKESRGSMKLTKFERFILNRKGEYKDISCSYCNYKNRIYSKKRPITFICKSCKNENNYPIPHNNIIDITCIHCDKNNLIPSKKRPFTFFCKFCKKENTVPIPKKLEVNVNDIFCTNEEVILQIVGIKDEDNIVVDILNINEEWVRKVWNLRTLTRKNDIGGLRKINKLELTERVNKITPLKIGTELYYKDKWEKDSLLERTGKDIMEIKSFSLDQNGETIGVSLEKGIFIGGKNMKELKSTLLTKFNILITNKCVYNDNDWWKIKRIVGKEEEEHGKSTTL